MVMLFLALFVFELGVVFAAMGTAMLFLRLVEENDRRAKLDRSRNVNLSWQSSPTPRNQGT
jgi:hypothetical protein